MHSCDAHNLVFSTLCQFFLNALSLHGERKNNTIFLFMSLLNIFVVVM